MWLPTLACLLTAAVAAIALRTVEPPPPVASPRNTRPPVQDWFPARVDHFHASNTDTFQMRFYYNNEFNATEQILIFVGGEWAISASWLTGGLMYEMAEELPAAMFYTEHRYYGLTRPTENTSVESLRYLTVDQSLADLAQFIQYVKSDQFEGGRFRYARVGLVGCSYAGSMATWARLAYPHLVDAAFSDSGPLHAQEDFPEYLVVIGGALRSEGGEECVSSVEDGMHGLVNLLDTEGGAAQVSTMFGTCSRLATSSPLDLATFFWYGITETFAGLVQYATPGQIATACAVLTDPSVANPTQRLANWIRSQPWTQPCIETRYTEVVAAHTNTSYDSDDAVMRLWTYQTCVEYGWYQTTSSSHQPFLSTVPLEYFHQMCKDFFSEYFSEDLLRSGIERTNLLFGGLTFLPDDVVSVVGTGDPWSPIGPFGLETPRAPVFVVPDVSHCRAIRSVSDSETEELRITKQHVKSFMTSRLSGAPWTLPSSAGGRSSSVVSVIVLIALLFIQM